MFEEIAIIGQSCVLPCCNHIGDLLDIVREGKIVISDPEKGYCRAEEQNFTGGGPGNYIPDLAFHYKGGYVKGFKANFKQEDFAIDVNLLKKLDPVFQWSLWAAREALSSSGHWGDAQLLKRSGLILGNLIYPSCSFVELAENIYFNAFIKDLKNLDSIHPYNRFTSGLPARMIKNALAIGGSAFSIDSACATSLYAIKLACDSLHRKDSDMMLAGAVCASEPFFMHIGFSSLYALSPSGCSRPLSSSADGLVPSEGAAFVVLKRLKDAIRDKNGILGIIKGISLGNDGKSRGFLSPSSKDQIQCLNHAYRIAGVRPEDISYVECHATGTPVGDATEIKSMKEVFAKNQNLAIGSLKANFGHILTVSGMAGVLKILGMFQNGFIPTTPNAYPLLREIENSNFRVPKNSEIWQPIEGKRLAAISNFGFGGNNAHIILEQWTGEKAKYHEIKKTGSKVSIAITGIGINTNYFSGTENFLKYIVDPDAMPENGEGHDQVILDISELSFPPKDLQKSLGQQLYILKSVGDAVKQIANMNLEKTGVFIGLQTDAQSNLFALRCRLEKHLEAENWHLSQEIIKKIKSILAHPAEAAYVLATMPNIVTNRINAQYNFKGYSSAIAAEELSGDYALETALNAVAKGEIEAAIVGAVDISVEPVQKLSAQKVLSLDFQKPMNAAVAMVIKRLDDAERDRDHIFAVVEMCGEGMSLPNCDENLGKSIYDFGNRPAKNSLTLQTGHSHAASGLLHIAAAALMIDNRIFRAMDEKRTIAMSICNKNLIQVINTTFAGGYHSTLLSGYKKDEVQCPAIYTLESVDSEMKSTDSRRMKFPLYMDAFFRRKEIAYILETFLSTTMQKTPEHSLTEEKSIIPPVQTIKNREPKAEHSLFLFLQRHRQMTDIHIDFMEKQKIANEKFIAFQSKTKNYLLGIEKASSHAMIKNDFKEDRIKTPTGPSFSREQLEILASGKISSVLGSMFQPQDAYPVQVRLPQPPLLLCDRVTGIEGKPLSMGPGTLWTETDVHTDSWYLCSGRMPSGIFIEAGQADLLLISWLGVDLLNKGERAYRLLGCEIIIHGPLPKAGDRLQYQITADGHSSLGDARLFFFHYDCRINGKIRISARNGQAGFFTKEELKNSAGVIWNQEAANYTKEPRLEIPYPICSKKSFSREDIKHYENRELYSCFGDGFEIVKTHSRTPISLVGKYFLMDEIHEFSIRGGAKKRGYMAGRKAIHANDWFFEGHFKNDPCMPGTLMAEACLQMMAFYMTALGFTKNNDGWRFEPVTGEFCKFLCRGQVTPDSKELLYEIFIDEVIASPYPTVYAHALCMVDGLKAFCSERMGLKLVPDTPLSSMPELLNTMEHDPQRKALFNYKSLIHAALGKHSEAFGEKYKIFEDIRRAPRLPGPPYLFMTRVTGVEGKAGGMNAGSKVTSEYDIPRDAWYFKENDSQTMPYCVLMEIALQPCGCLSIYIGSSLCSDEDFLFRNLDGKATQYREITPKDKTIRTEAQVTSLSRLGSAMIQSFTINCYIDQVLVFKADAVFGLFTPQAMRNQKGIPLTDKEKEATALTDNQNVNLLGYPKEYFRKKGCSLPQGKLLMIDTICGYWHSKGKNGKGLWIAEKTLDASHWFFKAHFYQDPVQPGSLGVEAIIQLMKFCMMHKKMDASYKNCHFEPIITGMEIEWHYRGQVIPSNKKMRVEFEMETEGIEETFAYVTGQGKLMVDGLKIYHLPRIGLRIVRD
ncbi:MAG: hypothetical protein HUU50_11040 [Candidatus Brocadiae bacterium]|nr:hypothetical protein [Candidatus Brocadiia bacterium]